MLNPPLHILQVSPTDIGGGAEKVAWDLFRNYRALGYDSWLAVGTKRSNDPNVIAIPRARYESRWSRLCLGLEKRLQSYDGSGIAIGPTRALLRTLAHPQRELEARFGIEDFNYESTPMLRSLPPDEPDIVHCHNLHGGYFDLRALPLLSRRAPLVLTLHDAWLLSGHCAHSFECERWKIGCGHCPDLRIYPAIGRDATAHNWRRKRGIFSSCRMYVATPSRWLMAKVEQSLLAPAIGEARVIPHGINLQVFRPAPKSEARTILGLPQDSHIVLFTANRIRQNIFKDYQTMREAVARVAAAATERPLIFLAVGDSGPSERIGQAEIRFVHYQEDPAVVARYYQAADVYIHAARAEVWGLTITEALACGTPVVATAVGGIPEQVKALSVLSGVLSNRAWGRYSIDEATGFLLPLGDKEGMAEGVQRLLKDDVLRHRLGANGAQDARSRFDLQRQAKAYLQWYEEITRKTMLQTRGVHEFAV
jgi:glycosyltransferase involved in cell wall biosynthesis